MDTNRFFLLLDIETSDNTSLKKYDIILASKKGKLDMNNKYTKSFMSHNARYGKLFEYLGESHYGFNVRVGDIVYMQDVELYGVVVSVHNDADTPCFYVSCRSSSGSVSHWIFTRSDCHYCIIPSLNTAIRLLNGVARIGSCVFDKKFSGDDYLIVQKVDNALDRCFVVSPRHRPNDKLFGYWCPVSDLVLKV